MSWNIGDPAESLAGSGVAVHRFIQVSNAANSTNTVANIATTNILPLLGNGSFNDGYNNPTGFGSLDLANNRIDVRQLNRNANMLCRVTITNNGVGTVAGATMVMRLIPDINTPSVFTDILSVPESFGSQAAFITTAFHGGVDAVQIGIRTAQAENVRLNGVYLSITDVV
ncbi:MAG: hypothetical protein ACRDBQ_22050 [Shewanella sp.]